MGSPRTSYITVIGYHNWKLASVQYSPDYRTFSEHSFSHGFVSILHESESGVAQLCPTVCDPMDCSLPGSPAMGFSRQEYWSGLPFPSLGDLPNPGIEPGSPEL